MSLEETGHIILMIAVIFVVALLIFPKILPEIESSKWMCWLASWTCPDYEVEAHQYIKYFKVSRDMGTRIKIQWLLLEGDDPEEYFYYYNSNDDKFNIPGIDIHEKVVEGITEAYYRMPGLEEYTIEIVVFPGEDNEDKDQEVIDLGMGLDAKSVSDFQHLAEMTIPAAVKPSGPPDHYLNYHLHRDLMVVGFNKRSVTETCGKHELLPLPEECIGKTCICLCDISDRCRSPEQRICYENTNVWYFISTDEEPPHYGDERVWNSQLGDSNELVLKGHCGASYNWVRNGIGRNLGLDRYDVEGRIFIKIYAKDW